MTSYAKLWYWLGVATPLPFHLISSAITYLPVQTLLIVFRWLRYTMGHTLTELVLDYQSKWHICVFIFLMPYLSQQMSTHIALQYSCQPWKSNNHIYSYNIVHYNRDWVICSVHITLIMQVLSNESQSLFTSINRCRWECMPSTVRVIVWSKMVRTDNAIRNKFNSQALGGWNAYSSVCIGQPSWLPIRQHLQRHSLTVHQTNDWSIESRY